MKKSLISIFGILLLVSCFPKMNTVYLEDWELTREESEILASKELYKYYLRESNLEYLEVMSKKHRFLLNYNPKIKYLYHEYSLGEGWEAIYGKVDEKTLKSLSEANIPFNKYDSLLIQTGYDSRSSGRIKSSLYP